MSRTLVAASTRFLENAAAAVTAEPFTMACWFKAASVATMAAMGVDDGATASKYAYLSPRSDGTLMAITTGPNLSQSANTYSAGVWAHAAGVFSSSSSRTAYLNGVAATPDSTAGTIGTVTKTHVGVLWATVQPFDGDVAEAAMWDVALTADEIIALSKGVSPLLIRPTSLVAYWPLYGNDSPETDRWRNRYDLTLNNAPTKADHPRVYMPFVHGATGIQPLSITGVTRNSVGAPLAGCTVKRFRTSDDVLLGSTTSDGSGNYTLEADTTPSYLVAYKAGSPDVAGVTVNTIIGV